jgi:KDO2-lipid IV(A) lauroyltransferase
MQDVLRSKALFVPTGPRARRDRREGAEWTRAQAAKNWIIRTAIFGVVAVADRIPERRLLELGRLVGVLAGFILGGARRTAVERAALSFPLGAARRVASESFANAGVNLARCLLLRRRNVRALDTVVVPQAARRTLAESLRQGRGVVFVSAHLGPFEAIAGAVAELGYAPAVVVRESYDPRLDSIVDAHRKRRGLKVIHRGSPHAGLAIMRALRAGQPVGFLPDLGARVASVEVAFLGERVLFPVGPQLIASRAAVPVLIGTLRPAAGSGPPHELVLERLDSECDAVTLTHRVACSLEQAILAAPEEWLWMSPPIRRLPTEKTDR